MEGALVVSSPVIQSMLNKFIQNLILKQISLLMARQAAIEVSVAPTVSVPIWGWVIGGIVVASLAIALAIEIDNLNQVKAEVQSGNLDNLPREIKIEAIKELEKIKQKAKEEEEEKKKNEQEKHLPWTELTPYRNKTRTGISSHSKKYYYEKDFSHDDTEVYKKICNKGIHVGSCSKNGGIINKLPVKGRTIDL